MVEFEGWSARRVEDERLIQGQGRFVGDMTRPGMLHAAFVRSYSAHGTVTDLDLDSVRSAPGVVAVFDAADLGLIPVSSLTGPVPVAGMDRTPLAGPTVRYVGEPLAVVVAETEQAAVDAVERAWIDIDDLPAVVDLTDAIADHTVIHPDAGSNLIEHWTLGDADADWDWPVQSVTNVENQRLYPAPIEPHTCLAEPTGTGATVWVGHQSAHGLATQLTKQCGFPVDVIVPDVGGSFGMKGRLYPEFIVVTAAARRLGAPVRWLESRRESISGGCHGRDMRYQIRMGGTPDGRIRRVHLDVLSASGAYPHTGAQVVTYSRLVAQEQYDIAHLTMATRSAITNTAPIAPYRGAGRPEAAYAMERAIDDFARAAGMNPIEVRRMNLLAPEEWPYETATGALYDSGQYEATLDLALRHLDVAALEREKAERAATGGRALGYGIGSFVERSGGPPDSGEYAQVELTAEGKLVVRTGSTANGQGHETVWAQVAAQAFGMSMEDVTFVGGNTTEVASGWGSTASRSAQIGASGVWRCAERLHRRVLEVAASMLEASPEDLVVSEGSVHVVGVPDTRLSLGDVVVEHAGPTGRLTDEEFYSPGVQAFPYGVHAAVVDVDVETGEVRVLRLIAVDDCGKVLNPMIVDGQAHGSLAQGLGQARFEAVRYDDTGQLLTGTLVTYPLPTAIDVPVLTTDRTVSPAPSNPLGAKGAGEGGCIGAPPAIVNATLDALAPYGVTHLDMPLTPDRVWSAIQAANQGRAVSAATGRRSET